MPHARWPRAATGGSALEIENPEPEFAFDRKGQVTSMAPSMQTESHRLIEHLMIAANEQVARHLEQASVPALYRVHEPPEPEAARRLVAQLASLGRGHAAGPRPPVVAPRRPSSSPSARGRWTRTCAVATARDAWG